MASLQKLGYDGLKSYAGVMVASNLDIAGKLKLGDSLVAKAGTSGIVYASISDLINYFSGQRSKVVNGDVMGIVDDALFFSVLSGAVRSSGADGQVFGAISKVSPFGSQVNLQLMETAVITGGRFLGDYIDATPQAPDVLKKIRRPTKLLSK